MISAEHLRNNAKNKVTKRNSAIKLTLWEKIEFKIIHIMIFDFGIT